MHSSPIDILPLNPRVIYEGLPNIDIAENRTATSSISLGTFLLSCLPHLYGIFRRIYRSKDYCVLFAELRMLCCLNVLAL
jgi:hypothetical protein